MVRQIDPRVEVNRDGRTATVTFGTSATVSSRVRVADNGNARARNENRVPASSQPAVARSTLNSIAPLPVRG